MKAVLDTNVFVSGIFFGGIPRKVLDLIENDKITPCFTPLTFLELKTLLLDEKFISLREILPFSINDFLENLKKYSAFYPKPDKILKIIKNDPADNHFLACALLGGASYIFSGDKHLLNLKKFQNIPILTPKQFLAEIK